MSDTDELRLGQPAPSAVTAAHIVYALHACAIVLGITGAPTVIGSFVGSMPSIAAVILNYVKRSDARDTWLATHYRWQIRTFWFALLWLIIALVLITTMVGIPIGVGLLIAVTIWLIYRVARGWLRLVDRQPMYD